METIPQTTESMNINDQMFYDMPRPEVPEVVFGVESRHIMFVAQIAGNIAVHAPESLDKVASYTKKASQYKEEILRMAPLLEKVVHKEEITQNDVRPYRAVIKDIARKESTAFRWAEKATNFLSFFGIRKPKRMLNNYVEKKFVERVPEMMSEAISYVKKKIDTVVNIVNIFLPKETPTESKTNEDKKTSIPETLKGFIDRSTDFIPVDVREKLTSAINFTQTTIFQNDTRNENKKRDTKTKKSSRLDKKIILNKVKSYYSNRQSRKAQTRA